jgi:hypothetical protein
LERVWSNLKEELKEELDARCKDEKSTGELHFSMAILYYLDGLSLHESYVYNNRS